jgi:SAM-dependent methyltransferase
VTLSGLLAGLIARLVARLPLPAQKRICIEAAIALARDGVSRAALSALLDAHARIETLAATTAVRYGGGVNPKHRIMAYHAFFAARVRPGDRVLDLGSGNGLLAHAMAEAGARVVGVEIDPANVEIARARHAHPNVEYRVGDALRDPVPAGFDVVAMSNVLEHLPDRPALLRRFAAGTGAARFLIRVPCIDRDWLVPLRRELGLEWRSDSTHETEYTMATFDAEIAEAGFARDETVVRWGEIWCEARPEAP